MAVFDYQPRTRIVFGPNTIESLGDLARELGARRVLVVSDAGLVAAGHVDHAIHALADAKLETTLFTDVSQNPTTNDVTAGVRVAKEFEPDLLIGLGGGSSMDCAKGINFVHSCGGEMKDYWGVGKATKPMLPMIAAPTTAGTGSETQSFALISDAKTHVKMACGDPKVACRVAVLDPALTVTQPPQITALTGIDAVSHALETYVCTRRNPLSITFSREAWRLLHTNFARVLAAPSDLEARGAMQLGAAFAGVAIENSMLGAAHALANPLTATYGVPHGQAVGMMLPHVIRFNAATCESMYGELWTLVGGHDSRRATASDSLAAFVTESLERANLETKLSECGVEKVRLPALAADAAQQWTGGFNPRTVKEADLLALYRAAF